MSNTLVLPAWLADDSLDFKEKGFNERADIIVAADGTDFNEFWNEVNAAIALRNQHRNRMIAAFSYPVTSSTIQITTPSEVEFEEASEYGQPVGIKGTGARFWRGFDFKFYDLAIRYTWMFLAEADRGQLQNNLNLALDADNKLLYYRVMKTIFNPLNVSGITDNNEPITAYKFYNADGEVPPKYKTNTFAGTHNHYLVSGGATVDSGDLDALATELGHHGYTMNNGYRLVLWVNPAQSAVIKTLRVAGGASYDFIPNASSLAGGVWVPNNGTYVGAPSGTLPGEIGTYGQFHIVEEDYIPAGYIVALASGGPDNLINPVGVREHKNPAYRGLKIIPGQRSQYPLIDSFYRRGIGTGILQRGGGVVMQVKASGSYDIPAEYV